MDIDIVCRFGFSLEHTIGFERVHVLEYIDMRTDGGQIDGGFDARISATYHGYAFSGVERSVAMRAECDSVSEMFGFAGNRQLSPSGSSSDDQCLAAECLIGTYYNFRGAGDYGGIRCPVLEQVYGITAEMFFKIRCESGPCPPIVLATTAVLNPFRAQ